MYYRTRIRFVKAIQYNPAKPDELFAFINDTNCIYKSYNVDYELKTGIMTLLANAPQTKENGDMVIGMPMIIKPGEWLITNWDAIWKANNEYFSKKYIQIDQYE